MSTALVLSGGGARAAYQVGVLKAIAKILPRATHNPFPIICGTSAGAINALALAGRAGPMKVRVRGLENIWRKLRAEQIYYTDAWNVLKNTANLAISLFHSGYGLNRPVSLLNNEPLRELLASYIRFRNVDEAIASGELEAISITAMRYATGQSITFFQGNRENWQRARRIGVRTGLSLDHLMASSAIPTIFPPVRIGDAFYGDGAMRQLKPLSPALHLGANKVCVIGVSDNPRVRSERRMPHHSPSFAQMIGHMLNAAFIDTIESDLETLQSINRLARHIPKETREELGIDDLKPISFLSISPSAAINEIAEDYIHELPRNVRIFLRMTGATARGGGSSAASYLLFEPGFCGELVRMGFRDGLSQAAEIRTFFGVEDTSLPERAIALQ